MSMFKSKSEFKRMPQVQQYYDIDDTFGVASRKKQIEEMKMRIEEAENRGKNVRLRNGWIQHQKKSMYQGQLDDVNRQLERPMMPFSTKEELLKKQQQLKDIMAEINQKPNIGYMIKTLKSELKLKPTYDELVGTIEDADKENRPPIDKIIDRRATLFRNNQFGSQLDNIDFLGLKKQEEDRAKEDVRQAQLRQAGIMAGTSTGTSSIRTSGIYRDNSKRNKHQHQQQEVIWM